MNACNLKTMNIYYHNRTEAERIFVTRQFLFLCLVRCFLFSFSLCSSHSSVSFTYSCSSIAKHISNRANNESFCVYICNTQNSRSHHENWLGMAIGITLTILWPWNWFHFFAVVALRIHNFWAFEASRNKNSTYSQATHNWEMEEKMRRTWDLTNSN